MENRTLIETRIYNDTVKALAAKVADGDLAYEKRAEAQDQLDHLLGDFIYVGTDCEFVMPKVARKIKDDFYPVL